MEITWFQNALLVFPFLCLVAKVFLFEALHFTVCNSLLSLERWAMANKVIVLGCMFPDERYNMLL